MEVVVPDDGAMQPMKVPLRTRFVPYATPLRTLIVGRLGTSRRGRRPFLWLVLAL